MTDPEVKPRHPAKFSRSILTFLDAHVPPGLYLDPCAGVGTIFRLEDPAAGRLFVAIEIEQPWADLHPETICGDMFEVVEDWVRLSTVRFDGVVTSWVYGNRMSDHHKVGAGDSSRRHSYTHDIRVQTGDEDYELDPMNAGLLYAWGKNGAYDAWHLRAYELLHRVVNDDGKSSFFNVKNFVRDKSMFNIVGRHIRMLKETGWKVVALHPVTTPGMRYGENYEARANEEIIIEARKV